MRASVVFFLIIALLMPTTAMAGLGSSKVAYIGGTTKDVDYPSAKKEVVGRFNTGDSQALRFIPDKKKMGESFIPYDQIIDIEYGQRAGRRVGAAIATTVLLTPVGLAMLLSKKRKHYVTIGYLDNNGQEHVSIFELGKGIVRTTLPVLKARSGKDIIYQDDEAKKFAGVR